MSNKKGIYPGTFDPITNGHRDIIERAALLVDELIIGVAGDSSNKGPTFSASERKALVEKEVAMLNADNIRVEVIDGLLVDFAKKHDVKLLIRGIRAVSDYEYEFQMAHTNTRLAPDIQTIFLPASEDTQFIASRFVKEIARLGGDVTSMVSKHVAEALKG